MEQDSQAPRALPDFDGRNDANRLSLLWFGLALVSALDFGFTFATGIFDLSAAVIPTGIALGLRKGNRAAYKHGQWLLGLSVFVCSLIFLAGLLAAFHGDRPEVWGLTPPVEAVDPWLIVSIAGMLFGASIASYRFHSSDFLSRYFARLEQEEQLQKAVPSPPPSEFPLTGREIPAGWWRDPRAEAD